MGNEQDFSINVSELKSNPKSGNQHLLNDVDQVGAAHGFVARSPKRRGRKASPRTEQIHAKVLPPIGSEIANEARSRGVTQGVLLEEAWKLYKETQGI